MSGGGARLNAWGIFRVVARYGLRSGSATTKRRVATKAFSLPCRRRGQRISMTFPVWQIVFERRSVSRERRISIGGAFANSGSDGSPLSSVRSFRSPESWMCAYGPVLPAECRAAIVLTMQSFWWVLEKSGRRTRAPVKSFFEESRRERFEAPASVWDRLFRLSMFFVSLGSSSSFLVFSGRPYVVSSFDADRNAKMRIRCTSVRSVCGRHSIE